VSAQNYSIIVGAGGAGGTSTDGSSGNDSTFSAITSKGGGGGGKLGGGLDGGSGGGGGGGQLINTLGGSGDTYGNDGGDGGPVVGLGNRTGGGGGGAGSIGETADSYNAGDGGTGLASSITGSPVARAGGGGGGTETGNIPGLASDGGGTGGSQLTAGTAGTVNTGGGGGGSGNGGVTPGGAGGSGIVIIRYLTSDFALDLTGKNTITFDTRSTETGSNLQASIHDSGGTTSTYIIPIITADTYESKVWDISGVADADKDAIDQIQFKILNADSARDYYIDNMVAGDKSEIDFSVRSCNDAVCAGESWTDIADTYPQNLTESNNQYFQYKANLSGNVMPKLSNVTVNYDSVPTILAAPTSSEANITDANKANFPISCNGVNDADSDTLTISYSLNNGTDWNQLGSTVTGPQTDYTHTATVDLTVITGYLDQQNNSFICKVNDGYIDSANSSELIFIEEIAPTGGTISYTDGYQTGTNDISITVNRGTDNTGMSTADTDYLLEYQEAPLSNQTCGIFGNWTDLGVTETAIATDYTFTGDNAKCYVFRYTVRDELGNTAVIISSQVVKIYTAPETTGEIVDYSASPDAAITITSPAGELQLPIDSSSIVLPSASYLDLTPSDGDGTDLANSEAALENLLTIDVTAIKKGASATGTKVTLESEGITAEIPDNTTIHAPQDWDGKLYPPQNKIATTTKANAFTQAAVSVGSDNNSLVFDKAAKVVIPNNLGVPYYYHLKTSAWLEIAECDTATTTDAGNLAPYGECYIKDSGETIIWTYHFTTFGMFSDTGITLANDAINGPTGAVNVVFTSENTIPANGTIIIHFEKFITDDIADMLIPDDKITSFTVMANDKKSTITSASLVNGVITLTIDEEILNNSDISISFASGVIDTNPAQAGLYSVPIISTGTDSDSIIDSGVVIAAIDNNIDLKVTVQEALIMTIDNNSVNLIVDPSVNNGVDQSEQTTLNVKTNAENYNIQAKLENANANDSGLHMNDGTNDYYIGNGVGENHFGYNVSGAGEADANFSTSVANIYGVAQAGKTNSTDHNIYYDLDIDYLTPAGEYEGTITYTAVPTF